MHLAIIDINQAITKTGWASASARQRALNIIVDKSRSMAGNQHNITQLISTILARTGLDYEINGYTTRRWHNSNAFKLWSQTKPDAPGRVNDVLYIKYGSGARSLGLVSLNSLSKENVDGEAILALAKRARVNVIINDNTPADYVTSRLNSPDILTKHWRDASARATARGVKLLIINLGQHKLSTCVGINLSKCLSERKLNNVINAVLKLSAH